MYDPVATALGSDTDTFYYDWHRLNIRVNFFVEDLNWMKKQIDLGLGLSLAIAAAILVFSHASRTRAMVADVAETPGDAKAIFDSKCASCHGKDGRAKSLHAKHVHARDLTDAVWQGNVSDERLFNSISNGKGKMPDFKKKLSEDQIDALVRYVRQLKR